MVCRSDPATHRARPAYLGPKTFGEHSKAGQHGFLVRRMRRVSDKLRGPLAVAPLLHVTLTSPPEVRDRITHEEEPDAGDPTSEVGQRQRRKSPLAKFRLRGREVVEKALRSALDIPKDVKLFVLEALHPACEEHPQVWAPHVNVFVSGVALRPDGTCFRLDFDRLHLNEPGRVRGRRFEAGLRREWRNALSALVGLRSRRPQVDVVAHEAERARFVLKAELRGFPGWNSVGAVGSRLAWSGGWADGVWSTVRGALGLNAPSRPGGCADCGAAMIPFAALLPAERDAVHDTAYGLFPAKTGAFDRYHEGEDRLTPEERVFVRHNAGVKAARPPVLGATVLSSAVFGAQRSSTVAVGAGSGASLPSRPGGLPKFRLSFNLSGTEDTCPCATCSDVLAVARRADRGTFLSARALSAAIAKARSLSDGSAAAALAAALAEADDALAARLDLLSDSRARYAGAAAAAAMIESIRRASPENLAPGALETDDVRIDSVQAPCGIARWLGAHDLVPIRERLTEVLDGFSAAPADGTCSTHSHTPPRLK